MNRSALVLITALLTACTDSAPRGGGDILVLGDSIIAWNGSQDAAIGDALAQTLDRSVISKAVSGAQFDNPSAFAAAAGFDIGRQLPRGQWRWVVMNGGANDLSSDCGCAPCRPSLDALIAPDGQSGAIPAFIVRTQQQTGAQVLWMGYYAGSGKTRFAGCRADLVEMEARIARFAQTRPAAHFVDAEDVIDRADPRNFDADDIHPSPTGSARIAALLARVIKAREGRSQRGQ